MITINNTAALQYDKFEENDIWPVEWLNLKPNTTHSNYYITFERLGPSWLKWLVKRFVRYAATTKSLSSCRSYIIALTHFGNFLIENYPGSKPDMVNRKMIIEFITYLSRTTLGAVAKQNALVHLRTLHRIILQEKWLPWPFEPIVFKEDLPKLPEKLPRFIPESVISQLEAKMHKLFQYQQYFVSVMLETGRRISEICTLKIDCLVKDSDGDWFLKIQEKKLNRDNLIPISENCKKAIMAQKCITKKMRPTSKYLFLTHRNLIRREHVSARHINMILNDFSKKENITDDNGEVWRFSSHQFRHTVGTRMINAGVSQFVIQRFLGHATPEMKARYAYIHDEKLKNEFYKFNEKLVDIKGRKHNYETKDRDANWLKQNITSQALPNGLCALPFPEKKCPHANACLSCANFRTNIKFLSQHKEQLIKTKEIIKIAKQSGFTRQLEMNLQVKKNLERIIKNLEDESNDTIKK